MGKKQKYLNEICISNFGIGNHLKLNSFELLKSKYLPEINKVYKSLNGQFEIPPTRYGSWDINLKDFIIELDEERHFNRYRLLTLNSGVYNTKNFFDVKQYINYCKEYEDNCLTSASWGKNWFNNSTEKQFGKSSNPMIFNGNGSSRWKQRAFYDFLKDITSKLTNVPVIRISIYDTFNSNRIDNLIKREQKSELINFIKIKIKKYENSFR